MNQAISFGLLLGGGVLLVSAFSGKSLADVIQGKGPFTVGSSSVLPSVAAVGQTVTSSAAAGSAQTAGGIFGAGAQGSRLDQGQDLTASQFRTPVSGTVIYSTSSDPGWRGGGYVAIKSSSPFGGLPSDVLYFAEGLRPTVAVGQQVTAGETIATPVANPYNGIVGNIEWGLANPAAPGQPLAQVISNPAQMVMAFYRWALTVGAPQSTSTATAGYG